MSVSMLQLDGDPQRSNSAPPSGLVRPKFNSMITSDRLRIGSGANAPPFTMTGNIRKGRKSIFKELGLDDDFSDASPPVTPATPVTPCAPRQSTHSRSSTYDETSFGEIASLVSEEEEEGAEAHSNRRPAANNRHDEKSSTSHDEHQGHPASDHHGRPRQQTIEGSSRPWYSRLALGYRRPRIKTAASAPPTVSSLHRLTMIALLIAVVLPGFSYHNSRATVDLSGANAGVIRRETSPTDVCTRWAQQAAFLNGTLYIYGGRAKDESGQDTNTWNNRFLTLDLTKSWDISGPPLNGLEIPDGPPKISMGYLWNDYENLYLYGGEFADDLSGGNRYAEPAPESIWRYSIKDKSWTEFKDPKTSDGKFAEPAGQQVHRAGEGAGLSVPELGLSWYFGGHLDLATTPGWSNQVARVYLKSLLEFTHPGYANDMVNGLHNSGAPEEGAFRNITQGGLQANGAEDFPERADGALVFVPGWGKDGVLLGLAGGTNETFTHDLSVLDVYDIATSEWYHQETRGEAPGVRVNLCAVVASASDASSFQVYVFGGQNLIPFGNQIQYNDIYILSIPSFTWHKVDQSDQDHLPAPRAGHTCTMRDGQMVVVGGYVGSEIPCDSPGMYVFDASKLVWRDRFEAGDHEADYSPGNSVKAGSYGYQVPEPIQEVIGGDGDGGATASTPVAGATDGPFATGTPPVYTITRSGHTATITQFPDSTSTFGSVPNSGGKDGSGNGNGPSPGLIAAGVLAGIFGLLAAYLGFCLYLYRRQVRAYKAHLAVANRYSAQSSSALFPRGRSHRCDASSSTNDSFGWVGATVEPKWISEETTPGSGSGSGAGSGSKRRSNDQRGEYGNLRGDGSSGDRPGTSSTSDDGSVSPTERLLEGEPSFFSVVMGPRRALRVVNGID